jgi:hypothetical protein
MAAKIGSDVKYKNKFFDDKGNEVKPVQKEGKMYWYSEVSGYHKDWFVKEQIKIGGKR